MKGRRRQEEGERAKTRGGGMTYAMVDGGGAWGAAYYAYANLCVRIADDCQTSRVFPFPRPVGECVEMFERSPVCDDDE